MNIELASRESVGLVRKRSENKADQKRDCFVVCKMEGDANKQPETMWDTESESEDEDEIEKTGSDFENEAWMKLDEVGAVGGAESNDVWTICFLVFHCFTLYYTYCCK